MKKILIKGICIVGIFAMLCIIAVSVLYGVYLYSHLNYQNLTEDIITYSLEHQDFTLKEVTKFDWDIAYIDHVTYSFGDEIKEKYNLDCELTSLDSEELYRIIFYNDGKFVKEKTFSSFNIYIKSDVEVVKPDTRFFVERYKTEEGSLDLTVEEIA